MKTEFIPLDWVQKAAWSRGLIVVSFQTTVERRCRLHA